MNTNESNFYASEDYAPAMSFDPDFEAGADDGYTAFLEDDETPQVITREQLRGLLN